MNNFFRFRTMISSVLIQILYIIGAVLITLFSLVMIGGSSYFADFSTPPIVYVGLGFLFFVVGNLMWRLMCESLIILFSMHDRLVEITESMNTSSAPPAQPAPTSE